MQQVQGPGSAKISAVLDAVTARRVIEVTYNGIRMELWPHEIFVRNQAIYVRAHNPRKARRHDEEPGLGNFNAAGLSDVTLAAARFTPLPSFDGRVEKDGDQTIAAVNDD